MSRLHRVLGDADDGYIVVEDVAGAVRRVSLLAYDGDEPRPGDWVSVHSGYALTKVDADEASRVAAALERAAKGEWEVPDE